MDALKKAETDKQEQAPVEETSTPVENELANSLPLELTSHIDEFDDLPDSDVVGEPLIPPREKPQSALELETVEPVQQQDQPHTTAVSKIRKTQNKQRLFIFAGSISLVIAMVSGYFFWKLNSLGSPAVISQSPGTPQNYKNTEPTTTTPLAHTETNTLSTNQIKRAAPIAQESFFAPDPEPVVAKQPIKVKKHSKNKITSQTLLKAYQAYTSGDHSQAKIFYNKVLLRLPRNRDALLGLAAISLNEGNTVSAKTYYQKILALNPADPAARTAMLDLNGVKDVSRDTSQIKHWLQTNNNDAGLQFVLGNRYAQAEQWSKAQQAYFQAFENSPGNADYAFNLAISLEQLNKPDLAIKYYRIAHHNASINKANFELNTVLQRLRVLESSRSGAAS